NALPKTVAGAAPCGNTFAAASAVAAAMAPRVSANASADAASSSAPRSSPSADGSATGGGDTIVGTGLARVVTMVERTTGFTRLRRVPSGEAEPTLRAIVLALHPLIDHVHSLTLDSGSEFAEHGL